MDNLRLVDVTLQSFQYRSDHSTYKLSDQIAVRRFCNDYCIFDRDLQQWRYVIVFVDYAGAEATYPEEHAT
jgi:hypothetical protein